MEESLFQLLNADVEHTNAHSSSNSNVYDDVVFSLSCAHNVSLSASATRPPLHNNTNNNNNNNNNKSIGLFTASFASMGMSWTPGNSTSMRYHFHNSTSAALHTHNHPSAPLHPEDDDGVEMEGADSTTSAALPVSIMGHWDPCVEVRFHEDVEDLDLDSSISSTASTRHTSTPSLLTRTLTRACTVEAGSSTMGRALKRLEPRCGYEARRNAAAMDAARQLLLL